MGYTPVTPFRRALHAAVPVTPPPAPDLPRVNKWQVLRDLAAARRDLGLSDRELTVLETLLSFHPGQDLDIAGALVVFPSNATLCARLNDMPLSTMRRHLARLVACGLVIRRDSPNGKRYRRHQGAFGFDLLPLVTRAAEFSAMAEARRQSLALLHNLRETVSLMRRDLAALCAWGIEQGHQGACLDGQELATAVARALRRQVDAAQLHQLEQELAAALARVQHQLTPPPTAELSTIHSQNEHHHQSSNPDSLESERAPITPMKSQSPMLGSGNEPATCQRSAETIPFALVREACPGIHSLSPDALAHWPAFVKASDLLRPMMGIGQDLWHKARAVLGEAQAATTLALILERFSQIRSPGAYLRSLVARAQQGRFTVLPMLLASARAAQGSQL